MLKIIETRSFLISFEDMLKMALTNMPYLKKVFIVSKKLSVLLNLTVSCTYFIVICRTTIHLKFCRFHLKKKIERERKLR